MGSGTILEMERDTFLLAGGLLLQCDWLRSVDRIHLDGGKFEFVLFIETLQFLCGNKGNVILLVMFCNFCSVNAKSTIFKKSFTSRHRNFILFTKN